MYAITGATGHVGGATAEHLLAANEPVRVVVRDADKGASWSGRGADVAVADLGEPAALAEALRGCRGVFVLLPTDPTGSDEDHRRLADHIAEGVAAAGVPHAVLLSSIGADLADGTGPIRWLHHLENRLRATGVLLTSIRSWHFQEKVEDVLDVAAGSGTFPVFGDSADVPTRMIATRDIGAVAAESLLSPPARSEIVDLDGPQYTERQVADELAAVLGTTLQVTTVPRAGWVDALVDAGLPPAFAAELAELYEAGERGILQARGDRQRRCTTEIGDTLRRLTSSART
ncbi:uncharacterized protein YbjT (DUF2867 family) [Haloactinopolyspora alba]|uniref:Uncharacterized protein YbjT (DUF2867 family) n=1 Tax=Haloactinopolyspora alba TaxID=648780 RepID=A0A2P8E7L8_9ACTN|nr:NAD(P)H-binding protein [Haloactinopolyspora alba]PSL05483.1 uncharacterized protein YbjT (DUF2867 family) [Haloactinopolyspora alba]